MATLRTLVVKLGLDSDKFDKGALKAGGSLDKLVAKVEGTSGAITVLGKNASLAVLATHAVALAHALAPVAGSALAMVSAAGIGLGIFAALKMGVSGVGDAMRAAAEGDAEALTKAMEKLSPSAQAFVRQMTKSREAFAPVRKAVQERLFEGLDRGIRDLTDATLPTLDKGLGGVAGSLNALGRESLSAASTPMFAGGVDKILGSTVGILDKFRGVVGPLTQGVVNLALAGLPLIERFAGFAAGGAKAAAEFLASEAGAKRLTDTATAAGDRIAVLARIAGNLGSGLSAIFGGANVDGASFLTTLEQLSARFEAWAKSAEGQQQIGQTMAVLGQIAQHLAEVIPQVLSVIQMLMSAFASLPAPVQDAALQFTAWSIVIGPLVGHLSGAVSAIRGVGSAASTIGKQFTNAESGTRKFGSTVASNASKAAKAIGSGAASIGRSAAQMAASFGRAAASFVVSSAKMIASAIRTAAVVVANWIRMAVQSLIQAARMAISWIIAMGPVGWIIAAVVALVALIIANWDTVVSWTKAAWSAIVNAVTTYVQFVLSIVMAIWSAIVAYFQWAWSTALAIVTGVWSALVSAVTTYVNFVLSIVSAIWSAIVAYFQWAWSTALGIISAAWDAIVSAVRWAIDTVASVIDWLGELPGKIGGWFSRAKDAAVDKLTALLDYVRGVPGRILDGLGNLGNLLLDAGKKLMQGLIDGIKNMAQKVVNAAKDVVSKVKDLLPFSPAKEGPFSGRGNPYYSGLSISKLIAGGLTDGRRLVAASAEKLAAGISMPINTPAMQVPESAPRGRDDDSTDETMRDLAAAIRDLADGDLSARLDGDDILISYDRAKARRGRR